jgi:dTDP-4-dehydrorhamnose 3,5-epimerase
VCGAVFGAAVDICRSSPNSGRWARDIPGEENHRQLWIPAGFSHGFLVLSDSADFVCRATDP